MAREHTSRRAAQRGIDVAASERLGALARGIRTIAMQRDPSAMAAVAQARAVELVDADRGRWLYVAAEQGLLWTEFGEQ